MKSTVYFKASVDREDLVTMLTMLPRLSGKVAERYTLERKEIRII